MNCGCPKGGCICQSCSMPMKDRKDYGTNADKSQSCDYCCYCYREGKFLNTTITLEQMINKTVEIMKKNLHLSDGKKNRNCILKDCL